MRKAIPILTHAMLYAKVFLLNALFLSAFCFLSSCEKIAISTATYDIAHHEIGETEGPGFTSQRASLGLGYSSTSITGFDKLEETEPEIESATVDFVAFNLNSGLNIGLFDRFDLGIRLGYGSIGVATSLSGKLHLKYQLTEPGSPLAVSIMPGIGFSRSNPFSMPLDDPDYESISSMIGYELIFPMSIKVSRHFWSTFTPKLFMFDYRVKATGLANIDDPRNKITVEKSDRRLVTLPAVSMGFRYRAIQPEFMMVYYHDRLVPSLSLALVFRDTFF